jgi:CRISPR/Cas system-associated exonuclease Cas4 (RecB family)
MILLLFLLVVGALALLAAVTQSREAHEAADLPPGATVMSADLGPSMGIRELRGLTLRDSEWGLVGRPDLLLESSGDLELVEKKRRRGWSPGRVYRSDRLQVGAYLLMCEADPKVGRRLPEGWVQYIDGDGRELPDGKVRVPNTDALRGEVIEVLRRIRQALRGSEVHRDHSHASRCRSCSVKRACGEVLAT